LWSIRRYGEGGKPVRIVGNELSTLVEMGPGIDADAATRDAIHALEALAQKVIPRLLWTLWKLVMGTD
jgi:hypothetical protein